MKRLFDPAIPELMDEAVLHDGKPSAELERDLENLRWLNRKFGAVSLLLHFLNRWHAKNILHSGTLRVLDLATGEGDLPRELVTWCRSRSIPVSVDAVDSNEATLAVAKQRSLGFPEITFHRGDIRSWGTGSWDLVLCSLALHHFSEADAILILRHARSLAGRNILVADLERSRAGALGIWLLTAILLREPMTVHDARLSIRRAFSYREFNRLATDAGWKDFSQARFSVSRQALWIEGIAVTGGG
jgi:2-polyprenyl-3-methyl-5-hydroxy-6-metoxy-1,4-benzoquinol methylase